MGTDSGRYATSQSHADGQSAGSTGLATVCTDPRRTAKLDDAAKFQPCPKMLLNRARRRDLR